MKRKAGLPKGYVTTRGLEAAMKRMKMATVTLGKATSLYAVAAEEAAAKLATYQKQQTAKA